MVIRDGKIANYHPYPPTPWNGSVRDTYGTPGPYEDAVQNTPIFEENGPENFKGVDIMLEGRTVTVQRIHRDYDGRVHLGVSVDEPGHEVLRETGRFLWFFPPEVEVVE